MLNQTKFCFAKLVDANTSQVLLSSLTRALLLVDLSHDEEQCISEQEHSELSNDGLAWSNTPDVLISPLHSTSTKTLTQMCENL